jgi:hypothetical protein
LLSSCFSIGDTPDKAASIIRSPNKYRQGLRNGSGNFGTLAAILLTSSLLSNFAAALRPGF